MSAHQAPVAAIILDMDGLMVDTEPLYKTAWQAACTELGFDLNDERYAKIVGRPLPDCERVLAEDYARPGRMLSLETSLGDRKELIPSAGEYLDAKEVTAAFGVADPGRSYIAPHQPNPHAEPLARQKPIFWKAFFGLLVAMTLAGVLGQHRRDRHDLSLKTVAGVEPGAEQIFLSEPFPLGRPGLLSGRAAVEVELWAPVDNSWLGTDLALINDDTGETHVLALEVGYYSGVADGESWSEGSRRASAVVPRVSAGRYVLRVEPSWPLQRSCDTGSDCGTAMFGASYSCIDHRCQRACGDDAWSGCPSGSICDEAKKSCVLPPFEYRLTLDYGTTRLRYGFLALFLLSVVPLVTLYRRNRFEQRRREDQDPITE